MKVLILILSLLFSASSFSQINQETEDLKHEQTILIGKLNKDGFLLGNYQSWFLQESDNYTVDSVLTEQISLELEKYKDFYIKIFLATWCSDSRKQVPRFYKIIDLLNIDTKVSAFALDEFKSCPDVDIKSYKIELVPTFIFYNGKNEIGRIIESPKQSLEADFLDIILKNNK